MNAHYSTTIATILIAGSAALAQPCRGPGWRAACGLCPLVQQPAAPAGQSDDITGLREQIIGKQTELDRLWNADKRDADKIKAATRELFDLRGKLAEKQADLRLSAAGNTEMSPPCTWSGCGPCGACRGPCCNWGNCFPGQRGCCGKSLGRGPGLGLGRWGGPCWR